MTPEDRAKTYARIRRELRELQREERDKKLRAGRAKPRTLREAAIFATDLLPDKAKKTPPAGENRESSG